MRSFLTLVAVVALLLIGTCANAGHNNAKWKSAQNARSGHLAHLGGGMGRGTFEGIGMGSSRREAIQNACGYGVRTPIKIGVTRGRGGYYATVFYR